LEAFYSDREAGTLRLCFSSVAGTRDHDGAIFPISVVSVRKKNDAFANETREQFGESQISDVEIELLVHSESSNHNLTRRVWVCQEISPFRPSGNVRTWGLFRVVTNLASYRTSSTHGFPFAENLSPETHCYASTSETKLRPFPTWQCRTISRQSPRLTYPITNPIPSEADITAHLSSSLHQTCVEFRASPAIM
jgi:hypothetical protein